MEQEQFEELVKLLKELNEHLGDISADMSRIADALKRIERETR